MLQSKINTKKSNVYGGAGSGVDSTVRSTHLGWLTAVNASYASSEGANALAWTPQAPALRTTFPSSQHKVKKAHVLSFVSVYHTCVSYSLCFRKYAITHFPKISGNDLRDTVYTRSSFIS